MFAGFPPCSCIRRDQDLNLYLSIEMEGIPPLLRLYQRLSLYVKRLIILSVGVPQWSSPYALL